MTVVAESEPAKRSIKEWLMAIMDEGLIERSWPFQKGLARGEARGEARGRDEGLAPLAHQIGRKLGRELTDAERATLRERLTTLGPDRLGDVALDLDAAALAAWLADPAAR